MFHYYQFRKKLWKLFHDENGVNISNEKPTKEEYKSLHKTIKKVQLDIENFSFNTSISSFMILVNYLKKEKCYKQKMLEPLLILLSPFAPFICEEIWHKLKDTNTSISYSIFPKYKESLLIADDINYPIAINGKKKMNIMIDANLEKDQIEQKPSESTIEVKAEEIK